MSAVRRLGPPQDYLSGSVFDSLGISQSVAGGGAIHISGVIALQLTEHGLEAVAPGDMAAQLDFVLDQLGACLQQHSAGLEQLLSLHVFVTDVAAFAASAARFNERLAAVRPASTVVQVNALGHPEALVEVSAVALDAGA